MKKLLISLLFAGLIFSACSELGTNSDEPVAPQATMLQKSAKQPIALPAPTGTTLQKQTLLGIKLIDGKKGGVIKGKAKLFTVGGILKIKTELVVPAGAFEGKKFIRYWLNNNEASFEFYPGMKFDKPLEFSATISGADFSSINLSEVDFAFIADDGEIEETSYKEISIGSDHLKISEALLPHFSRWAWVK